jgi:streptogramin lyase
VSLNTYVAGWSPQPTYAIIGPDGNLWAVNDSANVFKFDTTTFTTTTYPITGASTLQALETDGTFIYASDDQSSPPTLVFKINPSTGAHAPFFNIGFHDNGGSMYFDAATNHLWLASFSNLTELDLTGSIVSQYNGPHTLALGRLLNDGTFWITGGNGGAARVTPVASPGGWSSVTFGGGFTFPGFLHGGLVWAGGADSNIYAFDPSTLAVTTFTPSSVLSPQSGTPCLDDTGGLWMPYEVGGLWQATVGAPSVGVDYGSPVESSFALFDPATRTMWATGATAPSHGTAYSFVLPSVGNPQRLLV